MHIADLLSRDSMQHLPEEEVLLTHIIHNVANVIPVHNEILSRISEETQKEIELKEVMELC